MRHIFKCSKCGKYTMKESCDCNGKAIVARPLKYSADDRLAVYRRKAKAEEYRQRVLL